MPFYRHNRYVTIWLCCMLKYSRSPPCRDVMSSKWKTQRRIKGKIAIAIILPRCWLILTLRLPCASYQSCWNLTMHPFCNNCNCNSCNWVGVVRYGCFGSSMAYLLKLKSWFLAFSSSNCSDMPKQTFSVLDYCGPLVLGAVFVSILFVLSFIMNFLFIRKRDEITSFEKVRSKLPLPDYSDTS